MKFTIKSVGLTQTTICVELQNKEHDMSLDITFKDCKTAHFINKYRPFFRILSTKMMLEKIMTLDELTTLFNDYKYYLNAYGVTSVYGLYT